MTHLERAMALRAAGDLPQAAEAFAAAIKADPLNPEVWYQTAMVSIDLRDYRYAAAMLGSYVRFEPSRPGPFFDLAYCQMRIGDYDGAVRSLNRTVALRPHHTRALVALGQLLYGLGQPDAAYDAHTRALAVGSEAADDRAVSGIVRLLRGDYPGGWTDFEHRFQSRTFHGVPTWPKGATTWDGTADSRRTVYVHAEGGFGDTIMFARFLPLVVARAARVVLIVQPALQRLLGAMPELAGRVEFADDATAAPPDAAHVSTWSLPFVFGTAVDTIPDRVPYLPGADPAAAAARSGPLRVGIAWAGNRATTHDLDRSCPSLEPLGPLFAVPNVEWTSLQVGEESADAAGFPIAPCPIAGDFVDSARFVAGLDLVISVDTAVAHLAGALAVPTWVMVPAMPEFRWLLDRDTSPWYPRHRLFRREHTHDWPGVARRVAEVLAPLAAGRESSSSG
jgi:tetratricopeptide (TPR) repeat protein